MGGAFHNSKDHWGKKVLMQFYDMQYYAEVSGDLTFLYILGYIKEARLSCNLCGILLF